MLRRTAVITLLLATAVACGGAGAGEPASPAASPAVVGVAAGAQVLRCEQAIDALATPPAELDVVLDAVALPTRTALAAYPDGGSGDAASGGPLFAKFGLVARVGTTIDLAVPTDVAQRASIGWGDGQLATAVRVPDCPVAGGDDAPGEWIVFAGGYRVDQPMCLPVEVRTATGTTTVSVGVGAACPGQAPPPTARP